MHLTLNTFLLCHPETTALPFKNILSGEMNSVFFFLLTFFFFRFVSFFPLSILTFATAGEGGEKRERRKSILGRSLIEKQPPHPQP
jgi:hypothetical protein